jgi:hypothetical protein
VDIRRNASAFARVSRSEDYRLSEWKHNPSWGPLQAKRGWPISSRAVQPRKCPRNVQQ